MYFSSDLATKLEMTKYPKVEAYEGKIGNITCMTGSGYPAPQVNIFHLLGSRSINNTGTHYNYYCT